MRALNPSLAQVDWEEIALQLDLEGYALLPNLINGDLAGYLASQAEERCTTQRSTLESLGLGRGERIDFGPRAPSPLDDLRAQFYRHLTVIANRWNEDLGMDSRYPEELDEFLESNRLAGQINPQSHLVKLGAEGYLALHQSAAGETVFPMQVVALLSEPGIDFLGGEFVMTEQRPRMQSRPMVLPLKLGDAAIITTSVRPFRGARGHYRVNMKHAISRLRQGQRIGLELTFHDSQ
ncbi:2OG-Fe(II) oxygenase [Marinobacter sp.]|uniref:2OG-Fe(II) oxygenase n=1 Tax=Marinobacter sp. TaxID=50741 RepID=UPI002604D8CD|nr:2OG-Fe(II) oxygenase [Marinobacter sp.]